MTAEEVSAIAAIAAAVVAAAAAGITWWNAQTSRQQLELQRQSEIDRMNPYVWADIRPRRSDGQMLQLVVGNSGPTVATKVRVHVDGELPVSERNKKFVLTALERFNEGHASLPPGRVTQWNLGAAGQLLDDPDQNLRITLTIDAEGPSGPVPSLIYDVDPNDWRGMDGEAAGSMKFIERAITALTKQVGEAVQEKSE